VSLSSPAINGTDPEGSALAIWNEFLSGYFDGGTHAIGAMPVQFPTATLRFQEASQPQPLAGVGISVVWVAPSRSTRRWDVLTSVEMVALPAGTSPNQERMRAHCAFLFLVRAMVADGATGDNAQKQVQSAAGKLFGLLENTAATEPLSEKGLSKIRPSPARMAFPGDGAPGEDLGYRLRIVSCRAVLRWPVVSQLP